MRLKALLPPALRSWLRGHHRRWSFERALAKVRRLPPGQPLVPVIAQRLVYGWGNEAFSAEQEYLRAIQQAVGKTSGSILECGSGLTTLLLGMWAAPGRQVHSLENNASWADKVRSQLRARAIPGVTIHEAPLKSFGEYEWYTVDAEGLPMDIGLVICDGPPGDTLGGRYGLLPRLEGHLNGGCVILLDDAGREGEQETLRRWQEEFGCNAEMRGAAKPFAAVVIP